MLYKCCLSAKETTAQSQSTGHYSGLYFLGSGDKMGNTSNFKRVTTWQILVKNDD